MIQIQLGGCPEKYQAYKEEKLERFLTDGKWSKLSPSFERELYIQLNNTCSFLAISFDVEPMKGQHSIDHFMPKSSMPQHAYDWDNFRLCEKRLNASFPDGWPEKAQKVLDPASKSWHNNWFYLDEATGLYVCSSHVPEKSRDLVISTCKYLNKDSFPTHRLAVLSRVRKGEIAEHHLRSHYPGIYYALRVFPN